MIVGLPYGRLRVSKQCSVLVELRLSCWLWWFCFVRIEVVFAISILNNISSLSSFCETWDVLLPDCLVRSSDVRCFISKNLSDDATNHLKKNTVDNFVKDKVWFDSWKTAEWHRWEDFFSTFEFAQSWSIRINIQRNDINVESKVRYIRDIWIIGQSYLTVMRAEMEISCPPLSPIHHRKFSLISRRSVWFLKDFACCLSFTSTYIRSLSKEWLE